MDSAPLKSVVHAESPLSTGSQAYSILLSYGKESNVEPARRLSSVGEGICCQV